MLVFSFFILVIGALFLALSGIGLVRMPTLFTRMQATSKASTVGVIFMIIGLCLYLPKTEVLVKGFLICLFLVVTAPVAAHAIALAAKEQDYDR